MSVAGEPVGAPRRREARLGRSTPTGRRRLLAEVRAGCADRPGVYRMLDASGAVIYVGQSRTLRRRLLSYFRASGRGNRQARILRAARSVAWEYAPDEFGALLLELRLIKRHRPVWNVSGMEDEAPRGYVALTGGAVPGLRIVRRTDDARAESLWGPFRRVAQLGAAVRALAEITGVRDCSLSDRQLGFAADPASRAAGVRSGRREPGCLRVALGTCVGPCIGGGDADAYREGALAARDFLDAASKAPLTSARLRMRQAAAVLAFERAAALRDKAERLRWLHARVTRFRASMDRLSFRYLAKTADGGRHVYLLRRGTVRAEMPAPTTPAARAALEAQAQRVYLAPDPDGGDVPIHDVDQFYVVASFFRRRPEALADTVPGI